jgi:hypothetical protein
MQTRKGSQALPREKKVQYTEEKKLSNMAARLARKMNRDSAAIGRNGVRAHAYR